MSDSHHLGQVAAARTQALRAAADGDVFQVPIELATLLALGGEQGIDETARQWLGEIASAGLGASTPEVVVLLDRLVDGYVLDEEVRTTTDALLERGLDTMDESSSWLGFELGQRTQVLLLLAHVVVLRSAR